MSFLCSVLSDLLSAVIVGVALLWITHRLSKPKIQVSDSIITTPKKWVGHWLDGERRGSSDTIDVIERASEGNYFHFYLLPVENRRHWFIDGEAEVTKTSMSVWDSESKAFTNKKGCRWWSPENSGSDPLFTEGKSSLSEKWATEIPINDERHIVIAYNQIDKNDLYRFSVDTDEKNGFLNTDDKLSLPCYLLIELSCKRLPKKHIKMKIERGVFINYSFEVLSDFPSEIEEVYNF